MKIDLFKNTPASHPGQGMRIIRVSTALIIRVHAVRGLLHPGDVNDFGGLFSQLGLPLGPLWALGCRYRSVFRVSSFTV
jgi:hypothetical protein